MRKLRAREDHHLCETKKKNKQKNVMVLLNNMAAIHVLIFSYGIKAQGHDLTGAQFAQL